MNEGQTATLTINADQPPVEDVQVTLNTSGTATADSDYFSLPPTVTLAAGQTSRAIPVQTKTDGVVEGDERITVAISPSSSSYRVGSVNTATVTIAGTTGSGLPVVTIRPSTGTVTEGQPAQFVIGLDRTISQQLQINLTYGGFASEGSDYSLPGGLQILQPGQTALQLAVPTLDDGTVEPDRLLVVSLAASPDYVVGSPSTAATVIKSEDLPKVSIVGGPADVGKGGAVTFAIFADQAPIEDTSITYQVSGTAKPGQSFEALTGVVTLHAGETVASVPILTLNDDVVFLPTDIVAGTWPTRVGQVLVKEGDLAVAGKPLFSLTENGFTVTLRASAADRTKLKVGQAVTVELSGGGGTAPGVISELDETATTDEATKSQLYEGKVQVQGQLGAADGAPVTIKVTLQNKQGVLTVPIAAVKQNGQGDDVVRTIDLKSGRISEVKVKTGLSEGSFIEIESGLKGNEVVVVELDNSSSKSARRR